VSPTNRLLPLPDHPSCHRKRPAIVIYVVDEQALLRLFDRLTEDELTAEIGCAKVHERLKLLINNLDALMLRISRWGHDEQRAASGDYKSFPALHRIPCV